MKYKSYTELAEAFKAGKLEDYILQLDNDACYLLYVGAVPDGLTEDAVEAFRDQKADEADGWFKGKGCQDLSEVCEAAGIPAEWM